MRLLGPGATLRQTRAGGSVLATLAALVLVASFVAAAAPRLLTNVYDSALRELLERTPSIEKDVRISGQPRSVTTEEPVQATDLDRVSQLLRTRLPPVLAAEVGAAGHISHSVNLPILHRLDGGDVPGGTFALQFQGGLADAVRYVDGGPPEAPAHRVLYRDDGATRRLLRFDVAISTRTSEVMNLAVGNRFVIGEGARATAVVRIVGVFAPIEETAPYWDLNRGLLTPTEDARVRPVRLLGSGVVSPAAFSEWFATFGAQAQFVWRYSIDDDHLVASDTGPVATALEKLASDVGLIELPGVDGLYDLRLELASGLDELLRDFDAQLRTAQAVMGVVLVGLLAVALAVIGLAAQLVAERKRDGLGLVRARGASLGELAGLVLVEVGLVTAPAAAIGYLAAMIAIPGKASATSVMLCLLVAAATLVVSVVLAVVQHRQSVVSKRRDVILVRPSLRRLLIDGSVVVLAALGVALLRRRGLTTEATTRGVDPFLLTVPVLLGLAAGLVMLRVYPYPLRVLSRAAAGLRGAVTFLGIARTSREALSTTLPLAAILLGLALAVFGSAVDRGLTDAQAERAWRAVAADVQVRHADIGADDVEQVARLPGVAAVAPAVIDEGTTLRSHLGLPVTAIAIDLDAYRTILAGSPLDLPASDALAATPEDALPALVTPGLLRTVSDGRAEVQWSIGGLRHEIAIQGSLDGTFPALADSGRPIILLSYESLRALTGSPAPNRLFVGGAGIDTERLAEIFGTASSSVLSREESYREVRDAPLAGSIRAVFAAGVVAIGAYCALAVLLAIVVGAASRTRTIAYLRTLGLNQRQSRRLALLEIAPLVATAMVGGVLLGLFLPRIIGPAVDLRPYAGGGEVASYPLDPAALAVLVGGLTALVILAVLVDATLGRRRGLGAALRVGESS